MKNKILNHIARNREIYATTIPVVASVAVTVYTIHRKSRPVKPLPTN